MSIDEFKILKFVLLFLGVLNCSLLTTLNSGFFRALHGSFSSFHELLALLLLLSLDLFGTCLFLLQFLLGLAVCHSLILFDICLLFKHLGLIDVFTLLELLQIAIDVLLDFIQEL